MKSPSSDNEPGTQQEQKALWKSLKIVFSVILSLGTLFKLTEAEQEQAGIHLEHQGEE